MNKRMVMREESTAGWVYSRYLQRDVWWYWEVLPVRWNVATASWKNLEETRLSWSRLLNHQVTENIPFSLPNTVYYFHYYSEWCIWNKPEAIRPGWKNDESTALVSSHTFQSHRIDLATNRFGFLSSHPWLAKQKQNFNPWRGRGGGGDQVNETVFPAPTYKLLLGSFCLSIAGVSPFCHLSFFLSLPSSVFLSGFRSLLPSFLPCPLFHPSSFIFLPFLFLQVFLYLSFRWCVGYFNFVKKKSLTAFSNFISLETTEETVLHRAETTSKSIAFTEI